jgi:hypothetical protein
VSGLALLTRRPRFHEEPSLPGAPLLRERSAPPGVSGCPRAPFAWRPPLHRSDPSGDEVVELCQVWACRHSCARRAREKTLEIAQGVQREVGVPLRAPPGLRPALPLAAGWVSGIMDLCAHQKKIEVHSGSQTVRLFNRPIGRSCWSSCDLQSLARLRKGARQGATGRRPSGGQRRDGVDDAPSTAWRAPTQRALREWCSARPPGRTGRRRSPGSHCGLGTCSG